MGLPVPLLAWGDYAHARPRDIHYPGRVIFFAALASRSSKMEDGRSRTRLEKGAVKVGSKEKEDPFVWRARDVRVFVIWGDWRTLALREGGSTWTLEVKRNIRGVQSSSKRDEMTKELVALGAHIVGIIVFLSDYYRNTNRDWSHAIGSN